MPASSKRGLTAPQNTFLENILRKTNQFETNSSFLIANAQTWDWPIVFASEGFCDVTGYKRWEIMNQSCLCDFMRRGVEDECDSEEMRQLLLSETRGKIEMFLPSKSGKPKWFLVHIAPVTNDEKEIVLVLLLFEDVTQSKAPFLGEGADRFNICIDKIRRTQELDQSGIPAISRDQDTKMRDSQKIFNLENEALPIYDHEKPKTPNGIVLHYSKKKMVWDWFILLLTFYTAIIVPYNEAFLNEDRHIAWLLSNTLIDGIFAMDIFLNFRTTFVGPGGEVISESALIKMNYIKSWFVLDLVSCLPYDFLNFIVPASRSITEEGISTVFSSCKVIRLLRLARVARKLDHYIEYGGAMLVLLLFSFGLSGHWFACGWYVIGYKGLLSTNANITEYNWLAVLGRSLNSEYFVTANGTITGGPSNRECYIASLYFTMTSLTSVGFGNISANTEAEQVFCIIMLIFGALLYATIFGNVTTIIQQMYADTNRYHDMLNSVREFLKLYEIPNGLSDRIMDYIVSTWSMSKGIDTEKVLNYCPKDMKADICVHLNRKVFNDHASFNLASDSCLRAIAIEFVTTHTAPGDMIYHKGESVDSLFFVVSGSLEVLQDDDVVAILCKGDAFGDAFWEDDSVGHSECHVRALTYCDLHSVKRDSLLRVLNFYPAFGASFAQKMDLTYNIRKRVPNRKIADVKREEEAERQRLNDPNWDDSWKNKRSVRTAVSKFKSPLIPVQQSPGSSEDERPCTTSRAGLDPTSSGAKTMNDYRGDRKLQRKRLSKLSRDQIGLNISDRRTAESEDVSDTVGYRPLIDIRPDPTYLVMDAESITECIHDLKQETRGQYRSINERMEQMDKTLSQVLALLQSRAGTSNINQNTNNNNRGDGENRTNPSVSISIPEAGTSTDQRETLVGGGENDEARRRYWRTRNTPVLNMRLPSFGFSRHFHQ